MDDTPKIFDGYTITREAIARGGAGVVHEALSPEGERVAIKVLNRAKIEAHGREGLYEKQVTLFKEEYQMLVGLKHPNIARVHKIGFFDGEFYIVSEFIDGKPLAEYLRGSKPIDMIPLFIQVLEGLDYIHKSGLIHLDIKSENILVTTTTGLGCKVQGVGSNLRPYTLDPRPEVITPVVKIIDFGIATAVGGYGGDFFGSIPYMAPEIAFGWRDRVDSRADLFSFGVLMYHCITRGRFPFSRTSQKAREAVRHMIEKEEPPSPPTLAFFLNDESLTPVLDKIVFSLLKKNPEDRLYGNARAVINAMTTKMPEVFAGSPEAKASYLIPEGNIHIGREKEQEKIFGLVDALLNKPDFQPPVVVIEGATGLGKSHLMQKIAERFSKGIERVSLHRLTFPADAVACTNFMAGVEGALLEARPIAMLLDDVHESTGDLENHKKIHELIARVAKLAREKKEKPSLHESSRPVLLRVALNNLGATFEQVLERFGLSADFVERIILEPFSFLDLYTYLKSTPALKKKQIPGEWMERIHSRTGGNPWLIREHLEYIDSGSLLFNLEGDIVVNPEISREAKLPPPGIKARLEGIFECCDADEKKILELGSVWNWQHMAPMMSYADICELLPITYLKQKIENLVGREILTSSAEEDAYKFTNGDYFPSLIYERMSREDRELLHERIASHLKKKVWTAIS